MAIEFLNLQPVSEHGKVYFETMRSGRELANVACREPELLEMKMSEMFLDAECFGIYSCTAL